MDTIIEAVPSRHHPRMMGDVGSVDGLSLQLATPNVGTYVIGYDMPYGGKISALRMTCDLGQGEASVLINGIVVEGIDHVPLSAGTRSEINASGNNTFNPNDDIILRIDSGPAILNFRATLVISNKSVQSRIIPVDSGVVFDQLAITSALAGLDVIPLSFTTQLLRNPSHIFLPTFVKNAPSEDNVQGIAIEPFSPGNYLDGWNYYLSGQAVLGQVMRYCYIK